MRVLAPALAAITLALAPAVAHAEDDPVAITLTPWNAHDGVERPFRYIVEVAARGAEPVEVVADRRLLRFEVRPQESRRRFTCRHPAAPSRVSESRVRTLRAGDAEGPWREWIDLRMYCTGRALDALAGGGASVEARYGWPRRARTRWVARRPEAPLREWIAHLDPAPFVAPAVPRDGTTTRIGGEDGPSPIDVSLTSTSARTGASLVLRTAIRAREGSERVYTRPDAWSFRVRGPLGDVVCRAAMGGGSPPPDLFRRITTRVAAREALDADYFCPEHTFELAGVYEVVPEVTLPHSGEEWDLGAVTGRFRGPLATMRITRGGRGYVEQIPEEAGDGRE